MKMPIKEITIKDRIRKEHGNIDELAQNIKENGLINPIVVTPDNQLIAGERRIKACKLLGWEEIEVRVMNVEDYEDKLRLEISENENRKEFTFSERIEWAKKLEQIEKLKANKRVKKAGEVGGKFKGMQNFADPSSGVTRDKVAEKSGFGSGETYRKAKFIEENADEEMIKKLDKDEISVHGAYQKLKDEKEKLEKENVDLEDRVQELNDDKKTLKDRMQTLENKLENNNSQEIKNELEEVEEELKNKEKTVKNLQSKLADVSKSEMKISTEKIKDRCREIMTENGRNLEEIKIIATENDVDINEVRPALNGLCDNLEKFANEIRNLKEKINKGAVIDV